MGAVEMVAIDRLVPWADNPRDNAAAVAGVAASIERFGFGAPIVARSANGEVIAGHTRLLAARELGLAVVPVRWLDLSADEAHALALADNKLAEAAEWDGSALEAALASLGDDPLRALFGAVDVVDPVAPGGGGAPEPREADLTAITWRFTRAEFAIVEAALVKARAGRGSVGNAAALALVCEAFNG